MFRSRAALTIENLRVAGFVASFENLRLGGVVKGVGSGCRLCRD
jgi:hypothetical protein